MFMKDKKGGEEKDSMNIAAKRQVQTFSTKEREGAVIGS